MNELYFHKYHGLGNDFIIVDLLMHSGDVRGLVRGVRKLCDRRLGVGADGLLIISPEPGLEARLEIYNSDGSRPEMCGNGIRCVAAYLAAKHNIPQNRKISILSDAGLKVCTVEFDGSFNRAMVAVQMGNPNFDIKSLPCSATLVDGLKFDLEGFAAVPVSMGNPHAVIFCQDKPLELAKKFGPAMERNPVFPQKCNIEFARKLGPNHFEVGVWERGCGITLACGTGACAVACAASRLNLANKEAQVKIDLPGGSLMVDISDDTQGVVMHGLAEKSFTGILTTGYIE